MGTGGARIQAVKESVHFIPRWSRRTAGRFWVPFGLAGSTPVRAHNGKGGERVNDFYVREDGHVFLSQEELDEYRTVQVQMMHEEAGYVETAR